jgi:hypothetical protein
MPRTPYPYASAKDRKTCSECEGRRGFYSDTGPAPRWEACDYCDGAGTFGAFVPDLSPAVNVPLVDLVRRCA